MVGLDAGSPFTKTLSSSILESLGVLGGSILLFLIS